MNPYSSLKSAWHLDRIRSMRDGEPVVPVELQLILSDLCNHDCHFCAYRATSGLSTQRFVVLEEDGRRNHNPNRQISTAKAKEILRDAAEIGVKSVIFTGGGEPTVHADHLEVFGFALDLGLECSLNSNGVLFREGWQTVLPRFTYVRFSVDAGNAQEYADIRKCPLGHYGQMLVNLEALSREIQTQGTDCLLGTGYVVTPENYPNLAEGVGRLRDHGAKYVRLACMQSTEGESAYGDKWLPALNAANECDVFNTPDFQVHNLLEVVAGERPDYDFCGFQHLVAYVGANLEVYRCCYTAYTDQGYVGSLGDMTFKEYVRTRQLEPFCAKSCTTCPLNEKNRVIDYLCQKKPLHVNFV